MHNLLIKRSFSFWLKLRIRLSKADIADRTGENRTLLTSYNYCKMNYTLGHILDPHRRFSKQKDSKKHSKVKQRKRNLETNTAVIKGYINSGNSWQFSGLNHTIT